MLIFISNDPLDPSALHPLGVSHYVNETSMSAMDEDGVEVVTNIVFPFPPEPVDAPFNFDQYKVAALPVAVPLPPGHLLAPVSLSNLISLATFMECIESTSQQHYEWVNTIVASKLLYNGQSLHCHEPPVPMFFMEGLTTTLFKDYVYLTVLLTNPMSLASKDFLC